MDQLQQEIISSIYNSGYANGYNKAIDDFVYAVKRRFPNDKNGIFHIEKIAEQLKEGGTA